MPDIVTIVNNGAQDAVAITPSDTTDIRATKGVYVGGSGDLKVTLDKGSTVTFTGLSAGTIHPIVAKRIWATGTTATSILAVY